MNGGRAFSDVLQDILGNLRHLVRSEMRLAKAEIREDISRTAWASVWLALGILTGMGAGMLLLWSAVFAFAIHLPMWAAALVTCGITSCAALALILFGRRRLQQARPMPERTVETIKENLEWIHQSNR
jgi:hypothetical protein